MADTAPVKVKRSEFATFLNVSTSNTASWKRMGKGITSQKISYNPVTNSETYIDEDNATTTVESYAPQLDSPMTAYKGDAVFDFVDGLRQKRATGAECETEILLVYIYDKSGSAYAAEKQKVAIVIEDFGGDGGQSTELTFNLSFIGDATIGTCTITDGTPTFTESGEG